MSKPVNAFAMMMGGGGPKKGDKDKDKGKPTASTSTATPAASTPAASTSTYLPPVFSKSTFKGSGLGAGPKHSIEEKDQPWVEKYRPKNLGEVSAQDHTVAVLKKTLESANLPHMLFYGPPGTGKTSTILALCKQLFGPELYKSRVLELNASDERGISVVRDKVKNFAKTTVTTNHDPNYPAPHYKIIILDEADSMTQEAQSALRRIMETHSRITRFCLICNYVTRIIEPIVSRCSKFRFRPLDTGSTENRLREICLKENVDCPDDAIQTLIKTSDGDLRRAITYLQTASRLQTTDKAPLTALAIQEIAGVVPDTVMTSLTAAVGVQSGDVEMGDVNGAASKSPFDALRKAVIRVVRDGYSATQILIQLHDLLILDPLLPAKAKASISLTLGETDKCLTDGADEELQLLSACARIRKAIVATA